MKQLVFALSIWGCLWCIVPQAANAQSLSVTPPDFNLLPEPSRNAYQQMGLRTLEFWIGQDALLDSIVRDYPELTGRVAAARLNFQNAFGPTRDNIQALLNANPEVRRQFQYGVDTALASYRVPYPPGTPAERLGNVVDSLRERLMEPDFEQIRYGLLSFHPEFLRKPERELEMEFHLSIAPPVTNPKVFGAAFYMRFPLSWYTTENQNPNYIIHSQCLGGTGLLTMTVRVAPPNSFALPANLTPEWASRLTEVQTALQFEEPIYKTKVLTLPIGKSLCAYSLQAPTDETPFAAHYVDFYTLLPEGQVHIISFRVVGVTDADARRLLSHYENVMMAVAQSLRRQ